MMEYLEGVKKAKTLEIGELLAQAEGTEVKVNGAVHTIRDMGNVAFVILRKRDVSFERSAPKCSHLAASAKKCSQSVTLYSCRLSRS